MIIYYIVIIQIDQIVHILFQSSAFLDNGLSVRTTCLNHSEAFSSTGSQSEGYGSSPDV